MAIHLRANGEQEPVTPTGQHFTLDELQARVGGMIELVYTREGKPMFINEEGKLRGLPPNAQATPLVELFAGDFIVGDVLVCEPHEVQ